MIKTISLIIFAISSIGLTAVLLISIWGFNALDQTSVEAYLMTAWVMLSYLAVTIYFIFSIKEQINNEKHK